jgi:hypothetical protein
MDRELRDQVWWVERNWPSWGPQSKQAGIVHLSRLADKAAQRDDAELADYARRTGEAIRASLAGWSV